MTTKRYPKDYRRWPMTEQVCVCMELPGKVHWFVWSMKRRNVEYFVSRMSERHNMRLRAIVRIKRT